MTFYISFAVREWRISESVNPTTSTAITTAMVGSVGLDCKDGNGQKALGVRPRGQPWLSHFLAIRLLASYLVYLDLNVLIYEKTAISTLHSIVMKIDEYKIEGLIHPDNPFI